MTKPSQFKNYIFLVIITLLIGVVISFTTGTYIQYKLDISQEPAPKESLGIAYKVMSQTKNVWFLVGSLFH